MREAAERRQTTVLLCDIVGSTALFDSMDSEDARELQVQVQRTIKNVVQRYKGGTDHECDREEGDSQLFCFGLPHAQEDAAERAVQAALAAVEEVARLRVIPGVSARVRIGVATGVVVVGRDDDAPGQKAVITGSAPNLAARLQAAAEPNSVLISHSTRKLLGDLFEWVDLGALRLKGFSKPVRAWRAVAPRAIATRFDALHPRGTLSPLIGRESEIGSLLDSWDLVRGGVGQVLAIGGEAGIGKSRVLSVVVERLRSDECRVLRLQCSPYHVNTAFHPVARCLELALDLAPATPLADRQDRIGRWLGGQPARASMDAELVASMVAGSTNGSAGLRITPSLRRRRETLAALIRLFEALASGSPCLMLFEDAHWADPSTCEFLAELAPRVVRWPLFLVVTHRPDFDAKAVLGNGAQGMLLSRLSAPQAQLLATRLAGPQGLPAGVLERIVERSDGIPLFVEELTAATLERAVAEEGAAPSSAEEPVPESLRDSLMSRLDRLPEGKIVAQVGAVIGREFALPLLSAVVPLPEPALRSALEQLTRSGLLSIQPRPDGMAYVFKHALLQDTARDSLLRRTRRELNERIAQVLLSRFPGTVDSQPELLAHYAEEAGWVEQAVAQWTIAGDKAAQRSAYAEALNQLDRALALARSLPDGATRSRLELEGHAVRARALFATRGYASAEVADAYAKAREHFAHVPDASTTKFVVLRGECQMLLVQARYEAALDRAGELLELAKAFPDTGPLLDAHLLVGLAHMYLGKMQPARRHLETCASLYDPAKHLDHAVRQGVDIGSAVLAYLARALWIQGFPEQALQKCAAAVERARTPSIPLGLAQASAMMALVLHVCGDAQGAKAWVGRTKACAREQGLPYWTALADILDGSLESQVQPSQESVAAITEAIGRYRATGARLGDSWALLLLAEASAAAGLHDRAQAALDEGLRHVDTSLEAYYAPELHRRQGELLLARRADVAGAEACFHKALDLARRQHARSWELRAAMSLARLWSRDGRAAQAAELLAAVYGEFGEGHETADLREAAALLRELNAAPVGLTDRTA